MNLIIYPKGSDKIKFFLRNCIKKNNDFYGENSTLRGLNLSIFDFKWTSDTTKPVYGLDGLLIGYDKNVSEMIEGHSGPQMKKPRHNEKFSYLIMRNKIADLSTQDIDKTIDSINNLSELKIFLKKLVRAVKATPNLQEGR